MEEEHPGTPQEQWTVAKEKIEQTTTKLKNRKSAGEDEISNELLKYGGEELSKELHAFFNKITKTKKVPTEWKESITIPILKKGSRKDPANYRGITLLSSILKLFTKILSDEIHARGMCEEQQGFRKNRSTIDAIFTIRQIAEKSIEYNKIAYMCFVDLTKAFDRVRLPDVVRLLKKKNVHPDLIKIIVELNTDNMTQIQIEGRKTRKIPMQTGIRQGDSLSPILFNLIMEEIISEVKTIGKGYRLGDKEIKIICYADDAVLISEDEDNLQRMLFKLENTASKYNMKISVAKSKSLTISKEPRRCKLAIYNEPK